MDHDHRRFFRFIMVGIGGLWLASFGLWIGPTLVDHINELLDLSGTEPTAPTPPPPAASTEQVAPSGSSIDWALIGVIVAAVLGVLAVLVLLALSIVRIRRRREVIRQQRRDQVQQWTKATTVLDQVKAEYWAYLADPAAQMFTMPLLNAPESEPRTAEFLDAFNAAIDAQFESCPYSDDLIAMATTTAKRARDIWENARDHARRVGVGDLTTGQATKLTTAKRLLDQALDQAVTAAHRGNIITKITSILNEIDCAPNKPVSDIISQSQQSMLGARVQLPVIDPSQISR